jgi:NAD(P)H dehydrogenase (quinone)
MLGLCIAEAPKSESPAVDRILEMSSNALRLLPRHRRDESMTQSPILVSGASGQVGRRAIEILLEQKTGPIIATTRTPGKQKDLADRGVDLRFADFDDLSSVSTAFVGAKRILLISTNTFDVAGRRVRQHRNAIEAAKEVGAEHVVYTSFLKPHDSQLSFLTADHTATESILEESGLGYTILRNSFYTDMVSRALACIASNGYIVSASGRGRIAYVTREDCAVAAGAALSSNFQGKRVLDITGPRMINAEELAQAASEVLRTEVVAMSVTGEEFRSRMVSSGVPAPLASLLAEIERGVSQGAMEIQSDDFQILTGRSAKPITEFIISYLNKVSERTAVPDVPDIDSAN